MIKRLLIIEDDKDMCSELHETLTDLDYHVQTAYDGLSGKRLIEKNEFDIIMLDLKLPRFDGYQILKFIDESRINSKIIVMTARMKVHFEDIVNQNQEKNEDEILKIADHVLLKPFKIKDLINIIKQL